MRRIGWPEFTKRLGIARTEERDGYVIMWLTTGSAIVISENPATGRLGATYYTEIEANRDLAR
ncbi:MAG TPA: hypothetical protein VF104_10405 [Burkholderiales bacterium]